MSGLSCGVCSRVDEAEHRDLEAKGTLNHQFNVEGRLIPTVRGGVEPNPLTTQVDPVLRQALIDAGLITPLQLKQAADKIEAISSHPAGGGFYSGSFGSRPQ